MIGVFPAGVRVLWREPFHDALVPATALGNLLEFPVGQVRDDGVDDRRVNVLTGIRLDNGTVVAARRNRLVRR